MLADKYLERLAAYLVVVGGLVVVGVLAGAVVPRASVSGPVMSENTAPRGFPAEAPAPTASDFVAAQAGFQYLVSYTAAGFKPSSFTARRGEFVRFVNSSSAPVSISFLGKVQVLNIGAYREQRLDAPGRYTYSNGAAERGEVTVQ